MDLITTIYICNATLLLLHEIESAYEEEWDILRLPGKITGFLLIHIPIVIVILWGLIEIADKTTSGLVLGIVTGIGGIAPMVIHKIIARRNDHFNLPISNVIIYLNALTGIWLLAFSIKIISA